MSAISLLVITVEQTIKNSAGIPLSTTFRQTQGGRSGPYKAAAFDLTPCGDLPSLDAVGDENQASEILNAYLVRVGNNGTCLWDPNFQGLCNPPLSAATEYRFKYVLVNMSTGLAQDQTLWSDPIRTNQPTPYSAIDTWPGRRSGGMIVITSILGSLPFFLLVGFAGAIILSFVLAGKGTDGSQGGGITLIGTEGPGNPGTSQSVSSTPVWRYRCAQPYLDFASMYTVHNMHAAKPSYSGYTVLPAQSQGDLDDFHRNLTRVQAGLELLEVLVSLPVISPVSKCGVIHGVVLRTKGTLKDSAGSLLPGKVATPLLLLALIRVSLYNPGWPGIHPVDQGGLKLLGSQMESVEKTANRSEQKSRKFLKSLIRKQPQDLLLVIGTGVSAAVAPGIRALCSWRSCIEAVIEAAEQLEVLHPGDVAEFRRKVMKDRDLLVVAHDLIRKMSP
ncbi:hypothetical protein STEG23_034630, partial [Scotinomys teguina]